LSREKSVKRASKKEERGGRENEEHAEKIEKRRCNQKKEKLGGVKRG